jgi:hypothetical protein
VGANKLSTAPNGAQLSRSADEKLKPRYTVIPAKAGIHAVDAAKNWIPTFAGMTTTLVNPFIVA